MAKWGEGDDRWRVDDMGTAGRNVNNWHWVEKDALGWSKSRLAALLGDVQLASEGSCTLRTAGLGKVEGEAIVNNRKNKVIASYELDITIPWGGRMDGEEVSGTIRLPYVSEENHDEDPELKVTTATDSPAAHKAKEAILSLSAKKVLHDGIATFVKELRAGGPMREGASAAEAAEARDTGAVPAAAAAQQLQQNGSAAAAKQAAPAPAAASKPAPASGGGSGQQLKLSEKFYASAADIFECFTDARRMMAYTQSPAEAQATPGGRLVMFGGSVQGEFRELQPPSRIVMGWRFSSWEEGCMSQVVITIEEKEKGNVRLTLVQTGIPETDKYGHHDVLSTVEAGWRQQVFHRIRAVFGYGV